MKPALLFLSLLLIGAFFSCSEKEDKETEDTSAPDTTKSSHPAVGMIRKKIELENQLEAIISKANLSGSKELKEVEEAAKEADLHFYSVQRHHPKLQKLYKKAAGWQGRRSSNNPSQKAKAAAMMKEIHTEITKVSATLPEVQTARSAQVAARQNIHTKKRELARDLPEAKAILAELAEIDAQLVAQQP